MMLALALQLAGPAAPPEEPIEDIVVLGQRLKRVGVSMKIDRKGRLRVCRVTHSVGDAELDRFWCDAGVACAATRPKDAAALTACIEARKDEYLERVIAMRSTKRQN
ncbi:hypothetical protein NDN01_13805 [Sphingomonas sp. QA11]|uniref:hypothetical protein n=1 Tax=Sphingomonas sp. QA11 TaxID=2950605 RepID=UPI00234AD904|nr:hypothetical protein [Sphingomonas sp. QA11]WCM25148.1 hypothetical protein NDN01_13805 [Sphingomonas sp. QA11]